MTVEKSVKKKHPILRKMLLGAAGAAAALLCVYCYFGGLGTGKGANGKEFEKYAGAVESIAVPEGTRVIALGEATHGCAEFQELKLTVFRSVVEENGVRAFGLEGDAGGCEVVNRYIHGGEGSAEEAAAAIGFEIYRTPEMAALIEWMREYNRTAAQGGDLRFYGFDMQRIEHNYRFLLEGAKEAGIDTAALEGIWNNGEYSADVEREQRRAVIESVKAELEALGRVGAAHFADILLQNMELGQTLESANYGDLNAVRDRLMAQNVMWILEQEEQRGCEAVFLSGHNGHMKQFGSYSAEDKVMGNILADELGGGYFVIGTDFYRAKCSLPSGGGKRSGHVFYSRDPLAKAAKKCGYEQCWLDFSAVPQDSALCEDISEYTWLGALGDVAYMPLLMNLLPRSYRVWQSPSTLFDGMIFVSNAHPIAVAEA